MFKLRNGLSGAKGPERLALLNVEHYCRSQALQAHYWRTLLASRLVVFDLADVEPIMCSLKWARCKGHLLVLCSVRLAGSSESFDYRLKINPRRNAHLELQRQGFRCRPRQ